MLSKQDFIQAVRALGISGKAVCIHSSMKSFGTKVLLDDLLDAFIDEHCTVMVPSFSDNFEAPPVEKYMPKQNGAGDYSYFFNREYADFEPFDISCKEITVEEMGIFSKFVLEKSESVRGNNALNSFTALGKNASELVAFQTNKDVYAPLSRLCEYGGFVLLMGVDFTSATIIHYAEQVAGRNPFVRWTYGAGRKVVPVSAGSCSDGFCNFSESLMPFVRQIKVAESKWLCFAASDAVRICSQLIRENPGITHCGDCNCERCNDAVLGGPIIGSAEDFFAV